MKVEIKCSNNLKGSINISGAKNSSLPILAISLLTNKKMILKNVPDIKDIKDMIELLKYLGVKIKRKEDVLILKRKKVKSKLLLDEVSKIRASYYLIPGLINKNRTSSISYPGGCKFSKRPIDFHLYFLKRSGVKIKEENEYLTFKRKKLKNQTIVFPKATVGGTINAILHFVMIKKTTKIINQPLEPEVIDVIKCLKKMGANIYINNNDIIINGGHKFKQVTYTIMPDRIEFASYVLLSACVNSEVTLNNICENTYMPYLTYFDNLGIKYIYNKNSFTIFGNKIINNIDLIINHYPSFPTDLNPIVCAALLNAKNNSSIEDLVYPERISHLEEMKKLCGKIDKEKNKIVIKPSKLIGNKVSARDLRCGFSLIICAICASGKTQIEDFDYVNRGYENIINKLKSINVQIKEY